MTLQGSQKVDWVTSQRSYAKQAPEIQAIHAIPFHLEVIFVVNHLYTETCVVNSPVSRSLVIEASLGEDKALTAPAATHAKV